MIILNLGESLTSLSDQFLISQGLISEIVPEVCSAIYKVLQPEVLRFPSSESDWLEIARGFQVKWNFPHCLGGMDGKHVKIRAPTAAGSHYFNYKGDHSIVLLAIVDADLKFVYVDVGTNGRVGDAAIWNKTNLKRCLDQGKLKIPMPSPLFEGGPSFPFVLVGDEAFGLKPYLLKPYSAKHGLDDPKKIFNYR